MRIGKLVIPVAVSQDLWQHYQAEAPNECCGFLLGQVNAEVAHAEQCWPLINELASPTAFRTEAKSVLQAFRQMRQTGQEIVAIYHSHPTSYPVPSATDLQENTYGEAIPWLILGPNQAARAWTLRQTDYTELELILHSGADS